jgi:hypothetical protein
MSDKPTCPWCGGPLRGQHCFSVDCELYLQPVAIGTPWRTVMDEHRRVIAELAESISAVSDGSLEWRSPCIIADCDDIRRPQKCHECTICELHDPPRWHITSPDEEI